MGGNGDVHGDVSGEEAAWRDLIARFDQPVDTVMAEPPWPAREDLNGAGTDEPPADRGRGTSGAQGTDGASPAGDGSGAAGPAGASSSGEAGASGGIGASDAAGGSGSSGNPAGAGNSVGAGSSVGAGRTDDAGRTGSAEGPAVPGGTAGAGVAGLDDADLTGTDTEPAADRPGAGASGWDIAEAPGGRRRIIRRAAPVPRPAPADEELDDPDEDETYKPPPPEPLPELDPLAKGAWLGLLGGPGYLLVATLVGWHVSDFAALVAIVAFIGGFATLVLRMGDKPRDDDDDGAVV